MELERKKEAIAITGYEGRIKIDCINDDLVLNKRCNKKTGRAPGLSSNYCL
jgi:hypothetical protein